MAEYEKIRSSIKSGDILAWSHRSWSSWYDFQIQAVRFFTQSEYCHTGTAWVVGGRVFVIEAVTPKVRIYPLSKSLPFYFLPAKEGIWTAQAEEFALAQVGCEYSKWKTIKSFFGKLNNDSLWQCAHLTAAIAKLNGIDLGERYTPSAIVQASLENSSELILVNK